MELNKHKLELLNEAKVRGLCAAYSADLEGLLLRLILYCIKDDPSAAYKKFSRLTLDSKLKWAKKELKKHHPAKFKQHEKEFKSLSRFNEFRGQLLHCCIVWKDDTHNEFSVIDIKKIKGEWKIISVPYTKQDLAVRLDKFAKLIINFTNTTKDILQTVEAKYPELNKFCKA